MLLNGISLTKAGGISTFSFWSNSVGSVNQFDLVSGAGSNSGSVVFFDNLLITAIPEPPALALCVFAIIGLAGRGQATASVAPSKSLVLAPL